ncbi:uncharacterized protein RAG0_00412 [Rhynchosporium agropyri]|uniref:Uncharacterized protein n=1 Tax=Rhynchosporium agropyri TaxID=914238 RepID=A0A1E1JSN3_9HELO|nr:uncharacterized protein RAG0_00412 [Rhynchosporium agropyri]
MSFLNNLSSSLSTISKETLGPGLSTASKAVNEFSQSRLGPAIVGAAIGLDLFGKEKLSPAMEYVKVNAEPAIKKTGELAGEGVKIAGEYVRENAGPAMKKTGELAGEGVKIAGEENAGPAMKKTGNYVKKNPGKSALYAASAVTLLAPGIVAAPVLWAFGWGSAGVRGGSAAAAIHASIGNVASGSIFAGLQSAGVVGSAAVNGVVQAAGVVVGFEPG